MLAEFDRREVMKPPAVAKTEWRLLDLGPATAAENMALDRVLLRTCRGTSDSGSPPTLRWLQFEPAAVLIGAYQRVEEEIRLDYCLQERIDVNRRITGGGAIFFDRTQLGWEIVARPEDLGLTSVQCRDFEFFCRPVIDVLAGLGLPANFRPRNDIEINGRKISGVGGTEEMGVILFQGTLLVDFEVERMVRALRVPVEKLSRHEIALLSERVTWLSRELAARPSLDELKRMLEDSFARRLNVRFEAGALTDEEQTLLHQQVRVAAAEDYVFRRRLPTTQKLIVKGYAADQYTTIVTNLRFDSRLDVIESVMFSGDFFCFPHRLLYDLEHSLRGQSRECWQEAVAAFFAAHEGRWRGPAIATIKASIGNALARCNWLSLGLTSGETSRIFTLHKDLIELLNYPLSMVLLPYCCKGKACSFRYETECRSCGGCSAGTAVEKISAAGLQWATVKSFEHLMTTLRTLHADGQRVFLGACCEAFYLKHCRELAATGMDGILVAIDSQTCYDLGKATDAYAGVFSNQTELDVSLLQKIITLFSRSHGERTMQFHE